MACICFYFQVHQPYRLRRYSVFDTDAQYLDEARNNHILQRVAEKCYLPATQLLLDLIEQHQGRFRVAFSLTGMILEQWQKHCPKVLDLFYRLAATGCVEFLAETYHHSLAFLYSRDEFKAQVDMHTKLIESLFAQTPRVFRNTELIYSNELASYLHSWGRFDAVLAEGADHILGQRTPDRLFVPPGNTNLKLLLKNYRLSDDIAFRFSNRSWTNWPLTPEKFVQWISRCDAPPVLTPPNKDDTSSLHTSSSHRPKTPPTPATNEPGLCNLFMDYETFGEHQWEETGIFDFLKQLPQTALDAGHKFLTPSQVAKQLTPVDEYNVPHMISWADTERDLSAWLGNAMQSNALHELYRLETHIKQTKNPTLLRDWRILTSSDHFYYMCTKYFADGDVHKYFNPYESPYDSYINFMNVLDNLRTRMESLDSTL